MNILSPAPAATDSRDMNLYITGMCASMERCGFRIIFLFFSTELKSFVLPTANFSDTKKSERCPSLSYLLSFLWIFIYKYLFQVCATPSFVLLAPAKKGIVSWM